MFATKVVFFLKSKHNEASLGGTTQVTLRFKNVYASFWKIDTLRFADYTLLPK